MRPGWRIVALTLLCFVTVRAGEASLLSQQYTASWASPGFFPLGAAQVYLAGVENETGHAASYDAASYLADGIRQRLSAAGVTVVRSGDANAVVAEISIHLFQEGSAFGRWLAAGVGAAYVVVQAHFRRGGEAASADLMTVSVIGAGGLYSAGAEKTVVDDAADEIAAFLLGKAKK